MLAELEDDSPVLVEEEEEVSGELEGNPLVEAAVASETAACSHQLTRCWTAAMLVAAKDADAPVMGPAFFLPGVWLSLLLLHGPESHMKSPYAHHCPPCHH